MLARCASRISRFSMPNKYHLLDHKKMHQIEKKLYGDQKITWKLKSKFFLKEAWYTIRQGSKDLWKASKWYVNLRKTKSTSQYTGYQLSEAQRVKIDMIKFIPYSVILVVPFAEFSLPLILWLFPNAVPSFYLFDTAWDSRHEKFEEVQFEAHTVLVDRLMDVLINKFHKQPMELSRYEFISQSYFDIVDDLSQHLDYRNFNSDELIEVLKFLGGGNYVTGVATINKFVNLFTLDIPRLLIKICRFLFKLITKRQQEPYKDPFFVRGNFEIFKLNYFPFEGLKRQFLIWQINRNFKLLLEQDLAFDRYGMDDITGNNIKDFARERGLAALSCYVTLKNVIKNDWVRFATNEKFMYNNNAKLWYSVMMYNFLKDSSRQLN